MAEKYTPEDYTGLEIAEYRTRFPAETEKFTDEQLFNIVMETNDDLDDAGWHDLFLTEAAKLATAE